MTNLEENAMLIHLTIKMWEGIKTDKQISEETCIRYEADKDAARVMKKLLDRTGAYQQLFKIKNEARTYHYDHTLAWEHKGSCLLPVKLHDEYCREMNNFKNDFDANILKFKDEYIEAVKDVKERMGGMFKETDYPPSDLICSKFEFSIKMLPLPTNDIRLNLSQDQIDEIKSDLEQKYKDAMVNATNDIKDRLTEVLSKFKNKILEKDSDGKYKTFRDSLMGNVAELIDIVPLLNLSDDKKLNDLATSIKNSLCEKFELKKIRGDKKEPKTDEEREKAAKTVDDLLKKVSNYKI